MTSFRTLAALLLTSVLAACGGQANIDAPMQLASVTTSAGAPPASSNTPSSSVAASGTAAVAAAASSTMPAPDCADEGCASLRIIDGNAEAWRIDAQRRAARDDDLARF